MGFTRYWYLPTSKISECRWGQVVSDIEAVYLATHPDGAGLEMERTQQPSVLQYIYFTPTDQVGETFSLPQTMAAARAERDDLIARGYYDHIPGKRERMRQASSNFCKTNRQPYDSFVASALCLMHGAGAEVSSDDREDGWEEGAIRASQALGRLVEPPFGELSREAKALAMARRRRRPERRYLEV